ncbi:MAG: hypothetical protein HOE82_03600 [Gammaproteobacteria bacterium]|nr:hypothetical protein [Gammaproteobacteria bacterium]
MITERDVKRASRLILRLQVRFPNSFNNFKNNDPMLGLMAEEWAMDLQSLSDEDMIRGLDKVRTSGATFCPSLPEYIAMCKPEKRHGAHALDALPPPVKVVSDEKAKENIKRLKSMVAGIGRIEE